MGARLLTCDECEAAMCLWEECLLRRSQDEDNLFDWLRGGEGCASARDMCIELAKDLDESWKLAHEKYGFDDSFDWEFVPRWADEAMDLTEWENLTPRWWKYLAWKVTERWKSETRS